MRSAAILGEQRGFIGYAANVRQFLMMPDVETNRLKQAIAGDAPALATLLQFYEGDLLAYVERRLPKRVRHLAEPEDITQETFYETSRLIAGFQIQGDGHFFRWLMSIANHRIMRVIEKYRLRRTDPISGGLSNDQSIIGLLEQVSTYRRTPSQSAVSHELVVTIERCIEQLIPQYRQVIMYRYLEGLTPEQTATKMDRQVSQVYVLSSRALNVLREQLVSASRHI